MDKSNTPFTTLVNHYLTTCRTEGKTPKTMRGYEEKLGRFDRWIDGTLADFTIESVRDYIASLQAAVKWAGHPLMPPSEQRLSATTVSNHVRVLKGFATWLHEEGYTKENLLSRLKAPTAPKKVMQTLSEEEVSCVLGSLNPNTATGCRDIAILMLLLDTGLRCGELLDLKLEDLHLDGQWLKVMGKGQKERMVPFGSQVSKVLLRYITFFRTETTIHSGVFLTLDERPLTEVAVKILFSR